MCVCVSSTKYSQQFCLFEVRSISLLQTDVSKSLKHGQKCCHFKPVSVCDVMNKACVAEVLIGMPSANLLLLFIAKEQCNVAAH